MLSFYFGCVVVAVLAIVGVTAARYWADRRFSRSARARGLFEFFDGKRMRTVDPIEVLTKMEEHKEFRFDVHPSGVGDGDKEAIAITVRAVREAFGIPAFSNTGAPGLSTQECLRLFNSFSLWVAVQKKSIESNAT